MGARSRALRVGTAADRDQYNPGGALLNAMLGPAQRDCCNATAELASPVRDAAAGEQRIFEVIAAEWHQQRPAAALRTVAIVDVNPEGQYLYPEFLLYRELFRRNGLDAFICEPGALARRDGGFSWMGYRSISSTTV